MSNGMNRVTLFGNLGADPELRKTPSGVSVLKARLATNRTWITKEGVREQDTQWHPIVVFGARGEGLSRILRKGSLLLVDGRLQTHCYEKDGVRRYYTEVVAENVILGGRGTRHPAAPEYAEPDAEARQAADNWADEHAPQPRAKRQQATGGDAPWRDEQRAHGVLADAETALGGPGDAGPGSSEGPEADPFMPPLYEPRPEEPRQRRDPGGRDPSEPVPPQPRKKNRTPGGLPAVAA